MACTPGRAGLAGGATITPALRQLRKPADASAEARGAGKGKDQKWKMVDVMPHGGWAWTLLDASTECEWEKAGRPRGP